MKLVNTVISADYQLQENFGKLWQQYFENGYWKEYVNRMHKTMTIMRQLRPLLFVLVLLPFIPLSLFDQKLLFILISGLALHLAGALLSAITQTVHPVQLIRIIGGYVIIYLSYGLGYLATILNVIIPRKE